MKMGKNLKEGHKMKCEYCSAMMQMPYAFHQINSGHIKKEFRFCSIACQKRWLKELKTHKDG